jgi:hydrogenase maturation protease
MPGPRRIVVLGIGNPLKLDEGVGVRIVEEIMERYEFPSSVDVVDAGTMGMSMLPLFADHDVMIVADAVDGTELPPGTVVLMTPEELAPNQVMHSRHDMRFPDVLAAAPRPPRGR